MPAGPTPHIDCLTVAQVVPVTEAEGPGQRFAVWVQGCPLRCVGCCNPEFLPMAGGELRRISSLLMEYESVAERRSVEGLTLLGGEPFSQAGPAAVLAREVRRRGGSVMVFSGHTLAELRARHDWGTAELLAATDVLVDGPYLQEAPDTVRRWIGSTNQRIHFLTSRYREDAPCWREPNTLEIRLEAGELTVNGFPAPGARQLWQRPPRHTPRSGES